jgi:hypothetical protein
MWQPPQSILDGKSTIHRLEDVLPEGSCNALLKYANKRFHPDKPGFDRSTLFSTGDEKLFTKEAILSSLADSPLIYLTVEYLFSVLEPYAKTLLEKNGKTTEHLGWASFMVMHRANGECTPNKFHCDTLAHGDKSAVDYSFILRLDDPSNKKGDGLTFLSEEEQITSPYFQNGILGFDNKGIKHAGAPYSCHADPPDNERVMIVVMVQFMEKEPCSEPGLYKPLRSPTNNPTSEGLVANPEPVSSPASKRQRRESPPALV